MLNGCVKLLLQDGGGVTQTHNPRSLGPFLVCIESVSEQLIFAQDDVMREPAGDRLEAENHRYFFTIFVRLDF